MDAITLSGETLAEITQTVKARLPIPAGVELVKEYSSGKPDVLPDGTLVTTGGVLTGVGRSELEYSNGLRINTTWRFRISSIQTFVIIDQEEVMHPK